jgi:RNA polymerase sigma-70 factor, ECF subfamily
MIRTEALPWTMARAEDARDRGRGTSDRAIRFRAMVDAHVDRVHRTLRSLGVPQRALDDAVQHVFLVAFQKVDTIELGRERAFLVGVATGVAANVRRRFARSPETPSGDDYELHADRAPSPEESALSNERRALLERVLGRMPLELREVFVLFELEGLTTVEIAASIEVPSGTVASRLRRARALFRALLEADCERFALGEGRTQCTSDV